MTALALVIDSVGLFLEIGELPDPNLDCFSVKSIARIFSLYNTHRLAFPVRPNFCF